MFIIRKLIRVVGHTSPPAFAVSVDPDWQEGQTDKVSNRPGIRFAFGAKPGIIRSDP